MLRHRPVACLLSAVLLAELAGEALLAWVLPPNPEPAHPVTGPVRIAIYLDRALYLVWPAGLAALSLRVFARRSAWPVAVAYAAAVLALAVTYPHTRFELLRRAYLAAELAALLVAVGAFLAWRWRTWGKERADLPVTVTAVLLAGHFVAVLVGPYRFGLFGREWELMPLAYLAILSSVVLVARHTITLAHLTRRSRALGLPPGASGPLTVAALALEASATAEGEHARALRQLAADAAGTALVQLYRAYRRDPVQTPR